MRVALFALCIGLPLGVASAQIAIYPRGIVNAATSAPGGLPNGSIALGSFFSIYGNLLGPAQSSKAQSFPLSTTLANVSITVGQGTAAVKAFPYYVSAGLIDAILPSNAPTGLQPVTVTYNGTTSAVSPVNIVPVSFNFFAFSGAGFGTAAAENIDAAGAYTFNSPQASAKPGQIVVAYGTGLGAITTPDSQAAPGNAPSTPIQLFVGGVPTPVAYSGRAPGGAGEDQVNFTIPTNAPTGCWVPLYAVANGITSNVVTLSIAPNGGACSDPANPLAQPFITGKKLGTLLLLHTDTLEDLAVETPVSVQNDLLIADFANTQQPTPWPYAPLLSQPPPGSCTVIQQSGDVFTKFAASLNPENPLGVSPSFTVTGPSGATQASLPAGATIPAFLLGSAAPALGTLPNQLLLSPGNYTISAPAAGSVGAIQASVTMPASFSWTNRATLSLINRATPLTLNWTGLGATQYMAIFGGDVDLPTNSSAAFYCLAPAGASSFTVPSQILAAIPASHAHEFKFRAALYLWTTPIANGSPLQVQGIDNAYAIPAYALGKTVIFQ
ncbi:MAG TPA: hypothetical protein VGN17_12315 [Bryobacteraceae bacterium]|jgi:uncharacterized protein (TIGR03437 family)